MPKGAIGGAGSDVVRVVQALDERAIGLLAGKRSRIRALEAMLASSENVATVLTAVEAGGPLIRRAVLEERLLGYVQGLAAARGDAVAVAKQLKTAVEGLGRAQKNGDGAKSAARTRERTLNGGCSVREARAMRVAACKRPRAEELSTCEIGRLPPNHRFAATERVPSLAQGVAVPAAVVVEQLPKSQAWSPGRLRELLLRTDKLFPRVDTDRPLPMVQAATTALRAMEGQFAVIYRARFRKLEIAAAKADVWTRWFKHTQARIATLTASSASATLMLWIDSRGAARARALSPQQYASLIGMPLDMQHPVRRGLGVLELGQQRSVLGQGVDHDCAMGVWRWVIARLEERGLPAGLLVPFGDVFSGISTIGAALRDVVGFKRFRYDFAVELSEKAARAHARGWLNEVGWVEGDATLVSNYDALLQKGTCGALVAAGFRCAPFSAADQGRCGSAAKEQEAQCALAEDAATLSQLARLQPNAIVIETAANILNEKEHWEQMQCMVLRHSEFSWVYQVICPRTLLRKPLPRRRLFLIGVRLEPVAAVCVPR